MFAARTGRPAFALTFVALLLTGCAHTSSFTLHQPFAPPSQQCMRLESERAFYSIEGNEQIAALTFSLPGAVAGPRAFVIYVTSPLGTHARTIVPQDAATARGFIIQEIGKLAGRSDFTDGNVQFRNLPFVPQARRLNLDVRTADGARLVGSAVLEYDSRAVAALRREFAADIATLRPPPCEPDDAGESAAPVEPPVVSDRQPEASRGTDPQQP